MSPATTVPMYGSESGVDEVGASRTAPSFGQKAASSKERPHRGQILLTSAAPKVAPMLQAPAAGREAVTRGNRFDASRIVVAHVVDPRRYRHDDEIGSGVRDIGGVV